jgi:hypothetical protein
MVVPVHNPRNSGSQAGGSRVQGQPVLHSEALSQKKEKEKRKGQWSGVKYSKMFDKHFKILKMLNTYIDQSEVVFIDWKLLWTNVFFQSRGIGALKENTPNVLLHVK